MQLYATSFHGSFNHTADFSDPHGAMHGALCPGGEVGRVRRRSRAEKYDVSKCAEVAELEVARDICLTSI